MNRAYTEELIRKHEGVRYESYDDTRGYRTVGIGFNLDKPGADTRIQVLGIDFNDLYHGACKLEDQHCSALLKVDLDDAISIAHTIVSNFDSLPDDVQAVVIDMIFNLGASGFAKFKKLIAALTANDFKTAALEMEYSAWYNQVPNRAKEDIEIVRRHSNA